MKRPVGFGPTSGDCMGIADILNDIGERSSLPLAEF